MTTEALKSTVVTNLDAEPVTRNTSGKGAAGEMRSVNAFVTPTDGKTVGSTYRMVRLPSNAKVKHIFWEAGAMTQGPFDIGAYYSDKVGDGTPVASSGVVIDADFFASAVSAASAVGITDVTNESGTYPADKRNKALWDALGLSADPGGFIDIVLTSTNTITTGALVGVEVQYVQ